jgi:hypothetical protein
LQRTLETFLQEDLEVQYNVCYFTGKLTQSLTTGIQDIVSFVIKIHCKIIIQIAQSKRFLEEAG